MPIDTMIQMLGVKKAAFIAGFVGGIVSLRFLPELKRWYEKAFSVIGGAFASGYMTEPAMTYFDIRNGEGGIGFAIGLFGLSFAAAIIKTDWKYILKSRLSGDQ